MKFITATTLISNRYYHNSDALAARHRYEETARSLWMNPIEDHKIYIAHFLKTCDKIGKTSTRANLDKLLKFVTL